MVSDADQRLLVLSDFAGSLRRWRKVGPELHRFLRGPCPGSVLPEADAQDDSTPGPGVEPEVTTEQAYLDLQSQDAEAFLAENPFPASPPPGGSGVSTSSSSVPPPPPPPPVLSEAQRARIETNRADGSRP